MIFNLKAYKDLGRSSLGTFHEKFDTDKIKIFYMHKELKITKVEQLFPFLWNSSGCSSKAGEYENHYFSVAGPWWEDYFAGINNKNINSLYIEMEKQKEQIKRDNNVQET